MPSPRSWLLSVLPLASLWLLTTSSSAELGPEVRVSMISALDFEPAVAARNNHLVAVWGRDANGAIGSALSIDSGQTWINAGPLPPPAGVRRTDSMPTICVDGAGAFYAAALCNMTSPPGGSAIVVWKATVDGAQLVWHTGIRATPICGLSWESTSSPCYDMPDLECDPETGALYLSYTLAEAFSFDDIRNTVQFVRSEDSGLTWSSPQALSTAAANGSRIGVGPEGDVYVVWTDFSTSQIVGRMSHDSGATFDLPFVVAPFVSNLGSGPPEYRTHFNRQNPIFGYCHWHGTAAQDFPSFAIDKTSGPRSGTLYVTWAERATGSVTPGTFPVAEHEPNNWFATADTIEIGQDIVGRIEGEGFGNRDIYAFDGIAGTTLWLRAEMDFADGWLSAPPCNNFNVYCADDTLHRLAAGTMQESYRGFLPPVILTLPKTGRYFIMVHETSFTNGYVLHPRLFLSESASVARDHRDIVLTSSSDGGATWTPKVRVNDDAAWFDNCLPEIGVDVSGTVHLIWYDRRDDPIGRHANTYWSSSLNGASFGKAQRLSSVSSAWNYGISNEGNVGDHLGLAITGETVYALWTQRGRPDVDIYSIAIMPDAVDVAVSSFTASFLEDHVRVAWRVEDPSAVALFNLHRQGSEEDAFHLIGQLHSQGLRYEYVFEDRTAASGVAYSYRLEIVDRAGRSTWIDAVPVIAPTQTLRWLGNAPNPFAHATRLTLAGRAEATTGVSIFDVTGRKVRELFHGISTSPVMSLTWDGRDHAGDAAPSGVYIVQAQQGGRLVTTKILKLE
jgi:hypothetical protein